jgi:hypothetical protein
VSPKRRFLHEHPRKRHSSLDNRPNSLAACTSYVVPCNILAGVCYIHGYDLDGSHLSVIYLLHGVTMNADHRLRCHFLFLFG